MLTVEDVALWFSLGVSGGALAWATGYAYLIGRRAMQVAID